MVGHIQHRCVAQGLCFQHIDQLRQHDRAFRDALASPDGRDAVRANKALHFHVYDAAGSPMLRELIATMWLKAGPIINLDLGEASRRSRSAASVRNHADLVEAIARRDPDGAAQALAEDIRSAAAFILSRDALRD